MKTTKDTTKDTPKVTIKDTKKDTTKDTIKDTTKDTKKDPTKDTTKNTTKTTTKTTTNNKMNSGMLRSDLMTLCDFYIQPEAAFEIFSTLGERGCVQFEDMCPELSAFQRSFITELCRYADLERILRYIEEEIKKDKLRIPHIEKEPPALRPDELNSFENMLQKWEVDIAQISQYQTKLLQNLLELQEMYYVLKNIDPILGDAELRRDTLLAKAGGGGDPLLPGGKLHVRTGVVRRNKAYAFETMLWRISRGNIFFRPSNTDQLFEEPQTGTMVRKVAFVAIWQGDQLKVAMEKICTGFHAHVYTLPSASKDRHEMVRLLEQRISDLNQVIRKSKYHRCKQLRMIARQWEGWIVRTKKSKAIYHNINYFRVDITRKCLIGQGWMPTIDLGPVQEILTDVSHKCGSKVESFISKLESIETPPTFHRTNKFTLAFQALISAYGDSLYREINPGIFTVVTFPFLFAIMFGDCGHGSIMLCSALWMVIKEKDLQKIKSTNEIWNIFFGGRYVILLLSTFTMYTGFIYNDWFSKPLRLKESYWVNQFSKQLLTNSTTLTLDPANETRSYYTIGVDPVWALAKNKIMVQNSLKMKLSIIIGIIHMMFGLWLSLFNDIYYKKYYAIILEFIPQLIFLSCLFMWLVFLIFFKWFMYGPKNTNVKTQPGCAPLILILFIDMCLMRKTIVAKDSQCDAYMFPNQQSIQTVLLYVALANVPIMLFGSPIYLLMKNKKKKDEAEVALNKYLKLRPPLKPDVVDRIEAALREKVRHYSEGFGELMIHQGVHTIEYVLSTISHTASYLRLWALSLAHAELSEMLWSMVLVKLAISDHELATGVPKLFFIFAVWALFSLSILVLMEGLSAFLHTLRLHWVEFMSKFFIGGGKVFRPFYFHEVLYGDSKEDKMDVGCRRLID